MCPYLALWMLPVALGPALAIPLAALTGQRRAGLALRGLGLLRIPEEMNPFAVLGGAQLFSPATAAEPVIDPGGPMLVDCHPLGGAPRLAPPP
ncbi:MAG: glucan biosynthesis glucosyltransferase H, partial [Rhodopila sp.]|nr:glucan biosynthesis glucosyltransferase H [Rhodopila sp.]